MKPIFLNSDPADTWIHPPYDKMNVEVVEVPTSPKLALLFVEPKEIRMGTAVGKVGLFANTGKFVRLFAQADFPTYVGAAYFSAGNFLVLTCSGEVDFPLVIDLNRQVFAYWLPPQGWDFREVADLHEDTLTFKMRKSDVDGIKKEALDRTSRNDMRWFDFSEANTLRDLLANSYFKRQD